jgi:hypothetical protein
VKGDLFGFPDMIVLIGISPVLRSRTRTHDIGHDSTIGITPITDQYAAGFKRISPISFLRQ